MLAANTTYERASDSTVIGTTTADGIFDLGGAGLTTALGSIGMVWTGLENDWTASGNDCADWSDGTSGATGAAGFANMTNRTAIRAALQSCDDGLMETTVICVEQ